VRVTKLTLLDFLGGQIIEEIARLQNAYFKKFKPTHALPTYNPKEFQDFCVQAGHPMFFSIF